MIMMLVFNDENNDNDNHNQKQHKTAHSKEYAEILTPPKITICLKNEWKVLGDQPHTYWYVSILL